MSVETIHRAPIVCRAWCNSRDGHADEVLGEQRCETLPVRIGQSLAPMWESSEGQWNENRVEVQAVAGPMCPPQVLVTVYPGEGADSVEVRFTPAEARWLAMHLQSLAALAAGDYDRNTAD